MARIGLLLTFALGLVLALGAESGQAQGKKSPAKASRPGPKALTAGDVTYVVNKSAIGADGRKWTLLLEATSKSGDRKILIQSARAIAASGKTFEVKSPMGRKAVALPEGTKILLELAMGDLPKDVTSLPRIELYGDRVVGIPGFEVPPTRAFSGKKAAEVRPLVLQDVRVERGEK